MVAADPHASAPFLRRLASRLSEVQELRHALAAWTSHQGVPSATMHCVNLILDELITNVIEHGYRGQPTGRIEVEAMVNGDSIVVRLTDHAPAFDPLQRPSPDTSADIDHRHIGGLGILFARRLADEMSYRRVGPDGPHQGNEVHFVKRFEPPQPPASPEAD